ncbi:TPA: TetR/AcrR family transcriptional regulator [Yersinia enterocolitica]
MRDRDQTRARIMEAAKVAFSQRGYAAANIREIAAQAGITAALVIRYFGSKEKLFEEAVSEAFDLKQALAGVSRNQLGQAMADMLFAEQNDVDLTAMLVRAAMDPTVSLTARNLAHARMLTPLAALIGGRKRMLRAGSLLSLVTGIWFYRFALPVSPLADKTEPVVVRHIADLLQKIIDGDTLA